MLKSEVAVRRKLVFVLGSQRSGTTAMLQALGQDSRLQAENESPRNAIYDDYRLRPEPELRSLFWNYRRRLILKPVADVDYRSVESILLEFEKYDPVAVWLYRDPVNVWSSAKSTFDLPADVLDEWIGKWRNGNESLLQALDGPMGSRFAVVRYEELISERYLFHDLCEFLEVIPRNNTFWKEDRRTGRLGLPSDIQESITRRTSDLMDRLNERRMIVRPRPQSVELRGTISNGWNASPPPGDSVTQVHGEDRFAWEGRIGSTDLHAPVPPIMAHETTTFSFWAKVDVPRAVTVQLSRQIDPWDNLGFSSQVRIGSEWTHVGFVVKSKEDLLNARVHLTLPMDAQGVELTPVVTGVGIPRLMELICHGNSRAELVRLGDRPQGGRVSFRSAGDQLHDTQLILGRMAVQKDNPIRVVLSLRASGEASVGVAMGLAGDPWDLVDRYYRLEVSPNETTSLLEFVPDRSGEVRVYMDLSAGLDWIDVCESAFITDVERLGEIFSVEGAHGTYGIPPAEMAVRVLPCVGPDRRHADVQWSKPLTAALEGVRYSLAFRVRADESRAFGFGLTEASDPWTALDLYFHETAVQTWREFYYEIVPDRDHALVRALFDIGHSHVPIEFDDVRFVPVVDTLSSAEKERLHWIAASLSPVASEQR